jgi:lipopolysaccharide heptosyltransferase II
MPGTLHKTLIIRFSSVGDIVLSSLLVRVLRKSFPHAQIDYLVRSRYAELLRNNPHLSNIVEFPEGGTFRDLHRLRGRIRTERYDLVIDIHDSLRSRFLCFGLRTVVRINKRKLARFALIRFKRDLYDRFGGAPGVAQRYVETVERFGVADDGEGTELHLPPGAPEKAAAVIREAGVTETGLVVGISPSARHNTKIWPRERYAEMALALIRTQRARILLFGSAEDAACCREIRDLVLTANPRAITVDLAGRLSLTETAAAMDACAVVVANDSGLMHIAAARKKRIVAIFGPTVRQFGFFPPPETSIVVERPGLPCRPCTHIGLASCPEGHFKCMNEIAAATVVAAVERLLV